MHVIVFIFAMITFNSMGQNFTNSDLEGIVGMSTTPTGWFSVSHTDAACQAYSNIAASPDLTGELGPVPAIGVSGIPHSGNTFVSGLLSENQGNYHHEGIRQTVSGLTPGKPYTIHFFQTVVKQNNHLDSSGSWSLYLDNILTGTSQSSSSALAYNDQGLQWEERSISFTASQASHSFKFLPSDDDNNQMVPSESLRMGIDHINIIPDSSRVYHDTICYGEMATVWAEGADQYHWVAIEDSNYVLSFDAILQISPDSTSHYLCINNLDTNMATITVLYPPSLDLGLDHYLCAGDTTLIHPNVQHASNHLWNDGSVGYDLTTSQAGIHWMIAENSCGTVVDSIGIHLDSIQYIDFGFDSSACSHEPVQLKAYYPNSEYLWDNGNSSQDYLAETSGTYHLEISNECGSSTHEFLISYHECQATIEMPNVFSPQGDGINDTFLPIAHDNIIEFQLIILNRWGEVVFESALPDLGWNGEINNQPANEGVYFWKVVYSTPQGDNIQAQGSLSLVR